MEVVHLPHLENRPLYVSLHREVTNASFLRQQLLQGNTDFEYAFLDAAMLLSRDQVLAACFRAIHNQMQGRMRSKNVHSEIVFSLSPNNNITEAFRTFGLSESSINVLAIKVGDGETTVIDTDLHVVQGRAIPFDDAALAQIRDEARIRKVYKLDSAGEEAQAFVLGSMALKGS